jgi:hypothetical protein
LTTIIFLIVLTIVVAYSIKVNISNKNSKKKLGKHEKRRMLNETPVR